MSTVVWTGITSGTMTDLQERKLIGARVDLYGTAIAVFWTDDGTATGTSLFSSTRMPMVEVVVADLANAQAWTTTGHFGPMLRQEYMDRMGGYMWLTRWDSANSMWFTRISQGTATEEPGTHTLPASAASVVSKRPAFIYALGT